MSNRRIKISRVLLVLFAVSLIAGCATRPDPSDKEAVAEFEKINDPIEPTNRAIFKFNRALDTVLLKPAAFVYKEYLPDFLQQGIHNMLNNLRSPVVLLNNLLQGKFQDAGNTVVRAIMNSTVGAAGFMDVAAAVGIEGRGEDFGQTLAVWGVPEGPYIMLPVFGPSNPRDTIGLVADFYSDPYNYWLDNIDEEEFIFARSGVRAIDWRARNYDLISDLEKTSLDFYASVRSLYRQRRMDAINDGEAPAQYPAPGISERRKAPERKGAEISWAR